MNERENYIDNIRIFLTILVILHHTAITYGGPGGWYYTEKSDGLVSSLLLTVFVSVNQSFFMGLFFFLSAYFIPDSYQRKGPGRFITDRVKRLGIPLVFYSLILSPVIIYILVRVGSGVKVSFLDYYIHRDDWINLGVLWFTAALLVFTGVFQLIQFFPARSNPVKTLPGNKSIFLLALGLGVISFLVRIVFPIGWTLKPLGFQLAHFPQYICLFSLGLVAKRNRWIAALTYQQSKRWLLVALGLIIFGFPSLYLLKEITHSELDAFLGGFTLPSFLNSIWEQLTGISLMVALLGIGQHNWNAQNNMLKEMSRNAYAVYIIHPLVLVCVALTLRGILPGSIVSFLITGSISVVISFFIGALLTRMVWVREVV